MIAPMFVLGLEGMFVIIGAIHFTEIGVRWTRECHGTSIIINKVIKLVNSSKYVKPGLSRTVVPYQ
jgi:hypothetical protein